MTAFDSGAFDSGGSGVPTGARSITLLGLRQATLRRGGVENSTDLTATVLNDYANSAIAELYDLLCQKADDRFVTTTTLSAVAGTAEVALPGGFYELRLLEIVDSTASSGYTRLRPIAVQAKHEFSAQTLCGKNYRYWINAYQVTLVPTPLVAESLRLYYIPVAPTLVADADVLDGWNGYEEMVIEMMWRRCLVRRDLDTGTSDREIDRLIARVKTASASRDAEPFYLNPRAPGADEWQ